MTDKQEKITEYVQELFSGVLRKFTNESYFSHLDSVGKSAQAFEIPFGYEIGLLHDTYEDFPEVRPHMIIEKLVSFGYEPLDAEFISNRVIDLTNVYTTERYPDINKGGRSKLESERLASTHKVSQSVKCVDIWDNARNCVQTDKGFARYFLPHKKEQLKALSLADTAVLRLSTITVEEQLALLD